MKRFFFISMVAAMLTGCTTETELGPCKGVFNKDEENPKLKYELSTKNLLGAIVFSETLAVPIMVGGLWLWCPVEKK
jgi:hypothetical protein